MATNRPFWSTLFSAERKVGQIYEWAFPNTASRTFHENPGDAYTPPWGWPLVSSNTAYGVATYLGTGWHKNQDWSFSCNVRIDPGCMIYSGIPLFAILDPNMGTILMGAQVFGMGFVDIFNDEQDAIDNALSQTHGAHLRVPDDGAYHHYFVTYEKATDTLRFYLDSQFVGSSAGWMVYPVSNDDWLVLGAFDTNTYLNNEFDQYLPGAITAVRLFAGTGCPMQPSDVVLNSREPKITLPTQFASTIVCDYDFLNGTAADLSGNCQLFQESAVDTYPAKTSVPTAIDRFYTKRNLPYLQPAVTPRDPYYDTVNFGTYVNPGRALFPLYGNVKFTIFDTFLQDYKAANPLGLPSTLYTWSDSSGTFWAWRDVLSATGTAVLTWTHRAGFPRFAPLPTVGSEVITGPMGPKTLCFYCDVGGNWGYYNNGLPWRNVLFHQYGFQLIHTFSVDWSGNPYNVRIGINSYGLEDTINVGSWLDKFLVQIEIVTGGYQLTIVGFDSYYSQYKTFSGFVAQGIGPASWYQLEDNSKVAVSAADAQRYMYLGMHPVGNNWSGGAVCSSPVIAQDLTALQANLGNDRVIYSANGQTELYRFYDVEVNRITTQSDVSGYGEIHRTFENPYAISVHEKDAFTNPSILTANVRHLSAVPDSYTNEPGVIFLNGGWRRTLYAVDGDVFTHVLGPDDPLGINRRGNFDPNYNYNW